VLAGFFLATLVQSSYGGALTDPNGIALTLGPLDANLAVFSLGGLLVGAGVVLARSEA